MKSAIIRIAILALGLAPLSASAAGLAPRNVVVGSSGQGVTTSYTVNATTATTANIGSIKFEFCVSATGACVLPTGVVTTGATLTSQSGAVGFGIVNAANGAP